MASPFVTTARDLLASYKPRCTAFTFDPQRRFGMVTSDLGGPLLNVGVEGAMFIMVTAETFTDKDIDVVFHLSGDREEFVRWYEGCKHTFDGTMPNTAEQRALKAIDEHANAEIYGLMGLPVPSL
jgi:hypothetical protein